MPTRRQLLTAGTLSAGAALAGVSGSFAADLPTVNRRIVLASRPVGTPTVDNFRLESVPIPDVGQGQV
jgi:hypothetical protein